jgi:hypothetical protein
MSDAELCDIWHRSDPRQGMSRVYRPSVSGEPRVPGHAENSALSNAHFYALTCMPTHVLRLGRNSPKCALPGVAAALKGTLDRRSPNVCRSQLRCLCTVTNTHHPILRGHCLSSRAITYVSPTAATARAGPATGLVRWCAGGGHLSDTLAIVTALLPRSSRVWLSDGGSGTGRHRRLTSRRSGRTRMAVTPALSEHAGTGGLLQPC